MAEFLEAFYLTERHEGGYTKNPADNGNWTSGRVGVGELIGTMFGVSAPLLALFLGRIPTAEEMKSLSIETVKIIFKRFYWNKIKGDNIESQMLANKFYDNSINLGVPGAIILWQRDVLQVPITGIMDEVTLNKLNQNI